MESPQTIPPTIFPSSLTTTPTTTPSPMMKPKGPTSFLKNMKERLSGKKDLTSSCSALEQAGKGENEEITTLDKQKADSFLPLRSSAKRISRNFDDTLVSRSLDSSPVLHRRSAAFRDDDDVFDDDDDDDELLSPENSSSLSPPRFARKHASVDEVHVKASSSAVASMLAYGPPLSNLEKKRFGLKDQRLRGLLGRSGDSSVDSSDPSSAESSQLQLNKPLSSLSPVSTDVVLAPPETSDETMHKVSPRQKGSSVKTEETSTVSLSANRRSLRLEDSPKPSRKSISGMVTAVASSAKYSFKTKTQSILSRTGSVAPPVPDDNDDSQGEIIYADTLFDQSEGDAITLRNISNSSSQFSSCISPGDVKLERCDRENAVHIEHIPRGKYAGNRFAITLPSGLKSVRSAKQGDTIFTLAQGAAAECSQIIKAGVPFYFGSSLVAVDSNMSLWDSESGTFVSPIVSDVFRSTDSLLESNDGSHLRRSIVSMDNSVYDDDILSSSNSPTSQNIPVKVQSEFQFPDPCSSISELRDLRIEYARLRDEILPRLARIERELEGINGLKFDLIRKQLCSLESRQEDLTESVNCHSDRIIIFDEALQKLKSTVSFSSSPSSDMNRRMWAVASYLLAGISIVFILLFKIIEGGRCVGTTVIKMISGAKNSSFDAANYDETQQQQIQFNISEENFPSSAVRGSFHEHSE